MLAEWLRMENVVVLTTAGCSVGAAARLMAGPKDNNLECLVLDAVEKCNLTDAAKAIIGWKKRNDFGRGNFEEWLSYLFNVSQLVEADKSPVHSVHWKKLSLPGIEDDGDVVPIVGEIKNLCGMIEKAIYAECALDLNRVRLQNNLDLRSFNLRETLAHL